MTKNGLQKIEYSAIDFIVVSDMVEKWLQEMVIDEDGLVKIKGKKEHYFQEIEQ